MPDFVSRWRRWGSIFATFDSAPPCLPAFVRRCGRMLATTAGALMVLSKSYIGLLPFSWSNMAVFPYRGQKPLGLTSEKRSFCCLTDFCDQCLALMCGRHSSAFCSGSVEETSHMSSHVKSNSEAFSCFPSASKARRTRLRLAMNRGYAKRSSILMLDGFSIFLFLPYWQCLSQCL